MKKCIALFISLFMAVPSTAWTANRTFKPKLAGFTGTTEFEGRYQGNKVSASSYSKQSSDTNFREILHLGTKGYVYHPNLITFALRASEALEQEKNETGDKGTWRQFTSEAYEARAYAFPTHPYNLEVFSATTRPLIASNLTGSGSAGEQQRHGSYFRYRARPVSGSLNWSSSRNKSRNTTKDNNYWAEANHSQYTYLSGAARYAEIKSSDGNSGENTQLTLSNQHSLKMFTLGSSWQQTANKTAEKDGDSGNLRQRTWGESVNMGIPAWNLNPAISYGLSRSKSDRLNLSSSRETKNFTNMENLGATISHALYRSIYSNAQINHGVSDSSSGKNSSTFARGSVDYRKQIYRGAFGADVWKTYDNIDRFGSLTLLEDQAYSTAVAGNPFTLSDKYVDENTIEITVKTPGLDEETLVKNTHFITTTSGDTTTIFIINLPAPYNIININSYTLLLNYSFVNTTFELDTNSHGFSLQLSTLDSLLNPHYSFTRSTQELVDGSLSGGINNSEGHAVGVTSIIGPYLFGIDYSRTYATRESEKRWYSIGEYHADLSEDTKFFARMEREHTTYYPGDTTQITAPIKEPEEIYRATLNSSRTWPKMSLNVNIGTSYTHRIWTVTTSAYSFYSNLNWRLGKMSLALGANYSALTSTANTGNTFDSNTTVFYFKLKRKLF